MPRVTADASEMRTFAADMRAMPVELARHTRPVLDKAGVNIKGQLVNEMGRSQHFRQVAPSISYDITSRSALGTGSLELEVGPDADRHKAANLANIAYFGTPRGGGTVPDPQLALDAEEPKALAALADVMVQVWQR